MDEQTNEEPSDDSTSTSAPAETDLPPVIKGRRNFGTPFFGVRPTDWRSKNGLIVGANVQHWWDGDKVWFAGRVTQFNESSGEHLIKYDEDDTELWMKIVDEPMLIFSRVGKQTVTFFESLTVSCR